MGAEAREKICLLVYWGAIFTPPLSLSLSSLSSFSLSPPLYSRPAGRERGGGKERGDGPVRIEGWREGGVELTYVILKEVFVYVCIYFFCVWVWVDG